MSCKHEKFIEVPQGQGLCTEECASCGAMRVLDFANATKNFVPFKVQPLAKVIDFNAYKSQKKKEVSNG